MGPGVAIRPPGPPPATRFDAFRAAPARGDAAAWLAEDGVVGSDSVERTLVRLAPRRDDTGEPARRGHASFSAATSELRRNMLIDALQAARGNQTRAGILLGLHQPRHGGNAVLNLQARKLAHRKFRYWWTRLVQEPSPTERASP